VQKQAIVIKENDNVATAVVNLASGSTVSFFVGKQVEQLTLAESIPLGHKFALQDLKEGQKVMKYGESIGSTTISIAKGCHVHVHNMQSDRARGDRN
jgi:altronate dehydratase small subunit